MTSKKAAARQKQREEKDILQAENEQLKEQLTSMNDNMATILDELKQLKQHVCCSLDCLHGHRTMTTTEAIRPNGRGAVYSYS